MDRGPLLGALLRRSHQLLFSTVVGELAKAGYREIGVNHMAMLRVLWDHPGGLRATELAVRIGMTKQSMGELVDNLRDLGYVERVDDPFDKRAKLVRLTKRGHASGKLMRDKVRAVEADWKKRIGAERIEAVRGALAELLATFDISA